MLHRSGMINREKIIYILLGLLSIVGMTLNPIIIFAEDAPESGEVSIDESFGKDLEPYLYEVQQDWEEESIEPGSDNIEISAADYSDKSDDSNIEVGSYADEDDVLIWSSPGGWVEYEIDVEEEGLYQIDVDYFPFPQEDGGGRQSVILGAEINGSYLHREARSIKLNREFVDAEDQFDDEGNQIRSLIDEIEGWKTDSFRDSNGTHVGPLLFHLKEGKNTVKLQVLREKVALKSLTISPPESYASYNDVKENYPSDHADDEEAVMLEGEDFSTKNTTSVQVQYDRDALTTPKSLKNIKFNSLGGSSWFDGRQAVTWEFEVPEDGTYKIAFRGKQNYQKSLSVFRTVYIDGEIPFEELQTYRIPYGSSWQALTLSDEDGDPFSFYLEKGEHTLTLEVNHEPFVPVIADIEDSSEEVKEILEELRVATGDRDDSLRVWDVKKELPGLLERLEGLQATFETMIDEAIEINGETSIVSQAFDSLAQDVKNLLKEPDKIPNQQVQVATLQERLQDQRQELLSGPLEIEKFYIAPVESKLPKMTANWFEKVVNMFSSLVYSFSGQNELAEQDDDELNVWMMWGRDYAEELQQLADQQFTPEHGIKVNVNLIQDENLLIMAKAAGIMPDIALGVPSEMPFEMALRGAAKDLTTLPGSDDLLENYAPGTLLPYYYQDGYYGIPETINFKVLFYRKDILDQLDLDVPDTWDDVYEMMPTLLQNQMNFYVDPKDFTYMLYQNDVELYKQNGIASGLDDSKAFKAFEEWTNLFNLRGMDLDVESFYQQFRNGTFPIGISDFNDYMELLVAAPEILDVWGLAPVPGHVNDDGEVVRWSGGAGDDTTSMMLFSDTPEDKQDVAWEFLQWYASADIQTEYGLNLEQFRGETFRWNSANIEAFTQMPWRQDDLDVIVDQWRWIKDIVNVPGGYMTLRQIEFAWNLTVIDGENPRTELEKAVKEINRELNRKQSEFNLLDDEGNLIRSLDLPEIKEPWEGVKRFER